MLHFFRKIRHELIANNKSFRYFKYAIGEIVLVVTGILIALYINNWNETRKEQVKFNQVLVDVEQELIDNISLARAQIYRYTVYDSLCLKLFIDSIKFEDYGNYGKILTDAGARLAIKDDSFKKLNQIINLTTEQESIMDELIKLNNEGRTYLDDYGDHMIKLVNNRDESFQEHDWFENWILNQLDDERIIDFFINDLEYSKMAMSQFSWVSDYRRFISLYDNLAVSTYKNIYNYLDSLGVKHSDSLLFQYNPNDYKHYLGKYDSKWSSKKNYVHADSIAVSLKENKLIWTGFRAVSPGTTRTEIIPIDKYHFRDNRSSGIYHLEFNDQGDVNGIRYSEGPSFILKIEKVR